MHGSLGQNMPFGATGAAGDRVTASPLLTTKWRLGGMTSFSALHTLTVVAAMDSHFDLASVVFGNDLNSTYEIAGIAIAPSARRNDDINPVTAANAPVTHARSTFDMAGAFRTPWEQPASPVSQTFVVPAATDVTTGVESRNPLLYACDWTPCVSLDRADPGEERPLIFINIKSTSAVNGRAGQGLTNNDFSDPAQWPSVAGGRVLSVNRRSGDWFAGATMGAKQVQGLLPIIAIRTMSRARGHSVLAGGDSLTQGLTSIAAMNNFLHQACLIVSRIDRPVTPINAGWSGQTMTEIYTRMLRQIDLFRPTIVLVPCMSYNGAPNTQPAYDAMMVQFNNLVAYTRAKGAVPVAVTYPPFNLNLATDNLRKAHNNIVRARAAAGEFRMIDYDAVVSDGASPARTKPEYFGSDDAHIGDAGQLAIAVQQAAPVLATII